MRVGFRSMDAGASSCAAAAIMSLVVGESQSLSNIVLQNKKAAEDMDDYLISESSKAVIREESSYFAMDGMDFLIWLYQNKRLTWSAIEEVTTSLSQKSKYIPSGSRTLANFYPEQTGEVEWEIVNWLDKMSDVVIIDCGCEDNVLTRHVIGDGDVSVLCIKHSKKELDRVLLEEKKWSGDEFILLMDYDYNSIYSKVNISRIYRIPLDRIAVIPKNQEFEESVKRGSMKRFIRHNIRKNNGGRHEYFIRELKEASDKILRAACYGKL